MLSGQLKASCWKRCICLQISLIHFQRTGIFVIAFKWKCVLVMCMEGKCMLYPVALCSRGKLQVGRISTWNQYLLSFPIPHFLWVPVRLMTKWLLCWCRATYSADRWMGLRTAVGTQLWAVWCWARFSLLKPQTFHLWGEIVVPTLQSCRQRRQQNTKLPQWTLSAM